MICMCNFFFLLFLLKLAKLVFIYLFTCLEPKNSPKMRAQTYIFICKSLPGSGRRAISPPFLPLPHSPRPTCFQPGGKWTLPLEQELWDAGFYESLGDFFGFLPFSTNASFLLFPTQGQPSNPSLKRTLQTKAGVRACPLPSLVYGCCGTWLCSS